MTHGAARELERARACLARSAALLAGDSANDDEVAQEAFALAASARGQ